MYSPQTAGFATKLIHFGSKNTDIYIPECEKGGLTPLERNNSYDRHLLEQKLALLDEAKYALTFPSGLGAATALFLLIKPGEHIVIASEIYGGTEESILSNLTRFNIENTILTNVNDVSLISRSIKYNTKVIVFS